MNVTSLKNITKCNQRIKVIQQFTTETTINQEFHKQTKLDQITQERLCGYKHTHTYTHRGIISRNGYSWVTRDR